MRTVRKQRQKGNFAASRRLRLEQLDSRLLMCNDVTGTITGNVEWRDTVLGYCLTGDVTLAPGAKLTVYPGVNVTNGVPANRLIIQGELVSDGATFGGPQMQIDVQAGGKADFRSGTHVDGRQIVFEAGSQAAVVDTQFTAPLEYYSPNVSIFGSRFTPATPFGTFVPVTTTPTLVDRLYNGNTFDSPAEIDLVGSTTDDSTLEAYPNIARYIVAGDLTVEAGAKLTLPAGVELRTYDFNNDVFVDGTFNVTGGILFGRTQVEARPGGTLNITNGATVDGDNIYYLPGSLGTTANSAFNSADLHVFSAAPIIANNTFSQFDFPVHIDGNFVPKLYNGNVFTFGTTIGVEGVVNTAVQWKDYANIAVYSLDDDLTVSAAGNLSMLSVAPNTITVTTPDPNFDINVFGVLSATHMRFTGSTELLAAAGGIVSLVDSQLTGERIVLNEGSGATITASTLTLPLELYTHTAQITDTIFALPAVFPLPAMPVLVSPSLVPLLYDTTAPLNTFLANTAIRVIGAADTDATWAVYPNIAEYRLEGNITIPAGVTIRTQPGILIRMDEAADVVNVDGVLDARDTTFSGLETELISRSGGILNLADDPTTSAVTTVENGVVVYQPGSQGTIRNANMSNTVLFDFSPGLQVENSVFGSISPVYILPSLVPDLYDNTFLLPATIRVQGATSNNAVWQAYQNIVQYELSDDLIVTTGTTLTIGDLSQQVTIDTPNTQFDVLVDGSLETVNTHFSGISTEIVARASANSTLPSGDLRLRDATQIDGHRVAYQPRTTGAIRCAVVNTNVVIDAASATRMIFNDFTNGLLVAEGSSTAVLDVERQFWGATRVSAATIEPRILHKNDDPNRPQVIYEPFLTTAPNCASFRPNLTAIDDQTVSVNTVVGPLNFIVNDADTPADQLTITATSSNTTLIAPANITLNGSGTNWAIQLTPSLNEIGTSTITVRVEDAEGFFTDEVFTVTVLPPNDPPVAYALPDVYINEDQPLEGLNALLLFLSDSETANADLKVTVASSSNPDLLPEGLQNVYFDGQDWRLEVVPAPDKFTPVTQTLPDTLTLAVDDGQDITSLTVNIRVAPVNDAPRITLTGTRVAPNTPGGEFGDLIINDPDPGDTVSVSLSDGQFVYQGGKLKLVNAASWNPGEQFTLVVTATDNSGLADNQSQEFYQLYASAFTPSLVAELKAVDSLGFPLDYVNEGDVFYIQGTVTDTRAGNAAEGIEQAYFNVDLGTLPLPITGISVGSLFPNGHQFGYIPGGNFITHLGGIADPFIPVTGTQTLFTLQATVPTGATEIQVAWLADDFTSYQVRLADSSLPATYVVLDNESMAFQPLSLTVRTQPVSPQIDVTGNGVGINNSDFTTPPNAANFTDFGSLDAFSGSTSHTFQIGNMFGAADLHLLSDPATRVLVTGPAAADFVVTQLPASVIAPAGSSDLILTFDPQGVGTRQAIVTIWNDSASDTPFQFVVQGVGTETNLPPTDIQLSKLSVQGNTLGAVVGNVDVIDPNFVDVYSYVVTDTRFEVVNDRLKLRSNESLNAFLEPTVTLSITATDQGLQSVTRTFTLNVIPPPTVLRLALQAFAEDGVTPITSVLPYQNFKVRAFVQDLRAVPEGVKSAYFDLGFDPARASSLVNNPISFGALFPNLQFAGLQVAGLLDEAGGAASLIPTGAGQKELFTASFRAGSPGALTFQPTLAGSHLATLFGSASPVRNDQIDFNALTLNVLAPQFGWHNPNLAGDVDDNQTVDVQDVAYAVYFFTSLTGRDLAGTSPPPADLKFVDVVPDNSLDAQDILQVTYDYLHPGSGEGESASAFDGGNSDLDALLSDLALDIVSRGGK